MKKTMLLFMSCLTATFALAQRPAPDLLKTAAGTISIQPVYHASLVLTCNNNVIYVDPTGGAKAFEGLAPPDLVLITDVHPDHLDLETLKAIAPDIMIIAPQAVADLLPEDMKRYCAVIGNGEKTTYTDSKLSKKVKIKITAIPMYNLPEAPDAMHTKGRGNGYVLNFGGKNVYISGDTEDIPEMRSLKHIDVAFVCMNLPYTMDVNQAASAVLAFRPGIVYPYHYRGKDGMSDTNEFKKLVNKDNPDIEVRLRDWYAEYK